MQIKIDANEMSRALRALDSFIGSTTNSTSNSLRMYSENGSLRLERNDYETIVSYDTGIPVPDIAGTYIPAALTGSILRSVTGKVTMEIRDKLVSFGHQRGQFTVKRLAEVDWPKPEPIEMTPLVVNSGVFARALSQVEVSISTDKYRLNLSGAHVSSEDEYIILSSTDSYRMSQVAVPGTVNFTGILPGSVVHGLTGYLSGEDDLAIDIGVDKLSAQIVAGRLSVTTRLVNASFPDFTTVIAKAEENDNLIVVNRKDFVRVLRQATLLFDKEKPRASISVATNDDNEAEISVGSFSDLGEAENCVYGVVKDGGSFSISVNPAYLVAGLEHFDSEVVRFSSSGNGKGVCALTSDSDEFMYLFMPYNS